MRGVNWLINAALKLSKHKVLPKKVTQVFKESRYSYGSRRVSAELREQGVTVGRYKVRCLMQALNLVVRYPKRSQVTTDSRHSESIAPNTLDRQFRVSQPNQVWTTDITYVWTLQGWLSPKGTSFGA